jgi:NAD(P)-dependent dehydrogenase (short-subunit alcohol dehydrogenase family)
MAMFDLTGRVALVTGAGRGVGAGIAAALAGQGAAVAVNDIDADRAEHSRAAIAASGGTAIPVAFDVTDLEAVVAGVSDVENRLGPVDILVNNAGVPFDGMEPTTFREMDPAEWDRMIQLNLYGVLHCTKALIDGMCAREFGRVIVISSGAAILGLPIGVSLYGAAKAGAAGFIRHLAIEVAELGVTANALALGLMDTVLQHDGADDALIATLTRGIPAGRLGTPADIGAACVYLASDEASWITGQTIAIDGGATTRP